MLEMAVKLMLWCNLFRGGLQAAYAVYIRLFLKILFSLVLILLLACPTRHMGLGFVSHPLFFLLPFLMSALVASTLCLGPLCLHVLLVCDAMTLYLCVLQYPAGSKMQRASVWLYTRGING